MEVISMTEFDENGVERVVIERTEITRIKISVTNIDSVSSMYCDEDENVLDRALKSIVGRTRTI